MSKTILLVHGAWVTPHSWANFKQLFETKGYTVVVPPWPFMDKPVGELQRHPDPRLAGQTIKGLVDHFEAQIRALPVPPHPDGALFRRTDRPNASRPRVGRGRRGHRRGATSWRAPERGRGAFRAADPVSLAWMESHPVDVVQELLEDICQHTCCGRATNNLRATDCSGARAHLFPSGTRHRQRGPFQESQAPSATSRGCRRGPHGYGFHGSRHASKAQSCTKPDGHGVVSFTEPLAHR